jgi:hypothetical protein
MLTTDDSYENLKQSMEFIRTSDLSYMTFQKICSDNAETLGIKLRSKLLAWIQL